ncbi:MAG TPA: CDP-alcohol phosphatidyltransferase family protein [Patescibacteria group bacterium]|nr:CDP-alcohol phosphatidyltransferase family protein [Patescibacteria group bacterium]
MNSLRKIIKMEDPIYGHYVAQQLAYYVVRITESLNLRPNHFTIISFLCGLSAAVFFTQGTYHSLIIGVLLLNVSLVFDCCDGQLARLKGLGSQFGAWFDYYTDKIKDGAVLLGWTYGAYIAAGTSTWWIFAIAFIGIFFQFLRNITALNRDIFQLQKTGKKDKQHTIISDAGANSHQFRRSLKHSLLFKLADRIFLYTIFGIFNLRIEAIFVYTALTLCFAILSTYLNFRLFFKFDKENATLTNK